MLIYSIFEAEDYWKNGAIMDILEKLNGAD